jgi:preprotein translocase SecE subunit
VASDKKDKKKNRNQPESVRDRAERAISEASNPKKRQEKTEVSAESKRLKLLRRNKKEKAPKKDKKPRRFHIIPKFIRLAFKEIKLVTWPDARTTYKLTTAVIIFATVFAILVSLVDWGFGNIFKKVFLHG